MVDPENTVTELDQITESDRRLTIHWNELLEQQRLLDESTEEELLADYIDHLAEVILGELSGRTVYLHCTAAYAPRIDEDRISLKSVSIVEGDIAGEIVGISVTSLPHTAIDEAHPTIVLVVDIGSQNIDTEFLKGNLRVYTFCPIDKTTLMPLEDKDDLVTPDHEDEIALAIDEALLNEQIDLGSLVNIFQSELNAGQDSLSSLQLEVYLKYLNQIATFKSIHAVASMGISFSDGTIDSIEPPEDKYFLSGDFNGFAAISVQDQKGQDKGIKLAICARNKEGDFGVFVDDIEDIQLK